MKKIILFLTAFFLFGTFQAQSEFLIQSDVPYNTVYLPNSQSGSINDNYIYSLTGNSLFIDYSLNDGVIKSDKRLYFSNNSSSTSYLTYIDTKDYVYHVGFYTTHGNSYWRSFSIRVFNKNNPTESYFYKLQQQTSAENKQPVSFASYGGFMIFKVGGSPKFFDTRQEICIDVECSQYESNPNYMTLQPYDGTVPVYIQQDTLYQKYQLNENNQLFKIFDDGTNITLESTTFGSVNDQIVFSQENIPIVPNTGIIGYNLSLYNGGPIVSTVSDIYEPKSYYYNGTEFIHALDKYVLKVYPYLPEEYNGWALDNVDDFKIGPYKDLIIAPLNTENGDVIYYVKNDNNLYTNSLQIDSTIPGSSISDNTNENTDDTGSGSTENSNNQPDESFWDSAMGGIKDAITGLTDKITFSGSGGTINTDGIGDSLKGQIGGYNDIVYSPGSTTKCEMFGSDGRFLYTVSDIPEINLDLKQIIDLPVINQILFIPNLILKALSKGINSALQLIGSFGMVQNGQNYCYLGDVHNIEFQKYLFLDVESSISVLPQELIDNKPKANEMNIIDYIILLVFGVIFLALLLPLIKTD